MAQLHCILQDLCILILLLHDEVRHTQALSSKGVFSKIKTFNVAAMVFRMRGGVYEVR